MKINHLIVGAKDVEISATFYCELLGYRRGDAFMDTGTDQPGLVLVHSSAPELLLVPFQEERLPSPQHLAFETDGADFDRILEISRSRNLKPRSHPSFQSDEGVIDLEQSG